MKTLRIIAVLLLLAVAWDVLWPATTEVRQFTPWRLKSLIESGADAPIIIDVRKPWEYQWFHIPGAINLPYPMDDPNRHGVADTSTPIVVACMTGHRSMLDAKRLLDMGYSEVYNLMWGSAGYALLGGKVE